MLFNDRAQSSELEKHPEVPIYRARVQPSASAASWVTVTHQTSVFKVSWLSLTLTRQAHGCARRVSEAATQLNYVAFYMLQWGTAHRQWRLHGETGSIENQKTAWCTSVNVIV